MFVWYFSFWILSVDGNTQTGFASDLFVNPYDNKYLMIGIISIVFLIIAMGIMSTAARNARYDKDKRATAGVGLVGGILAIAAPVAYYFYLKEEIPPVFWMVYDESFGFYLPLIGGILGILGAIAMGYAYYVETRQPTKPIIEKIPSNEPEIPTPAIQGGKKYCSNCGAQVFGHYCQECGQKVD